MDGTPLDQSAHDDIKIYTVKYINIIIFFPLALPTVEKYIAFSLIHNFWIVIWDTFFQSNNENDASRIMKMIQVG